MSQKPLQIVILVQGGLIQTVHTDAPERVEVEVFDLDVASFETQAESTSRKEREAKYERAIQGMEGILR